MKGTCFGTFVQGIYTTILVLDREDAYRDEGNLQLQRLQPERLDD